MFQSDDHPQKTEIKPAISRNQFHQTKADKTSF